jgi:PAS domain-containing protein
MTITALGLTLDRARRLRVPPDSLTDLAGVRVSAEDFLAAVSARAAQPIWGINPDDVIWFADPAAITALGYDSADELLGRHHETIHYEHSDGAPYRAAECPSSSSVRRSRAIWTRFSGATARRFPPPTSRCRSR